MYDVIVGRGATRIYRTHKTYFRLPVTPTRADCRRLLTKVTTLGIQTTHVVLRNGRSTDQRCQPRIYGGFFRCIRYEVPNTSTVFRSPVVLLLRVVGVRGSGGWFFKPREAAGVTCRRPPAERRAALEPDGTRKHVPAHARGRTHGMGGSRRFCTHPCGIANAESTFTGTASRAVLR